MKKIHDSRFQTIYHDSETNMLFVVRKEETDEMNDDDYKFELFKIRDFIEEYGSPTMIIDERKFNFPITPNLQLWLAKEIFPSVIAFGLKKIAFIESKDIFVTVSIDQTINEADTNGLEIKHFDNKDAALNWVRE